MFFLNLAICISRKLFFFDVFWIIFHRFNIYIFSTKISLSFLISTTAPLLTGSAVIIYVEWCTVNSWSKFYPHSAFWVRKILMEELYKTICSNLCHSSIPHSREVAAIKTSKLGGGCSKTFNARLTIKASNAQCKGEKTTPVN